MAAEVAKVTANCIGATAWRTLVTAAINNDVGEIVALHRRSAYLEFEHGMLCVGLASLPPSGLTVLLAPTGVSPIELCDMGLKVGQRFSVQYCPGSAVTAPLAEVCDEDYLTLTTLQLTSPSLQVHCEKSRTWSAQLPLKKTHLRVPIRLFERESINPESFAPDAFAADSIVGGQSDRATVVSAFERGLKVLSAEHSSEIAAGREPGTGSGTTTLSEQLTHRLAACWVEATMPGSANSRIRDAFASVVCRQVPELAAQLRQADSAACESTLDSAVPLLGAGIGLTPSGDDFLCGVLLMLRCLDRLDLVQSLAATLEPELHKRTHRISAAHIQEAIAGRCGSPAVDLVQLVLDEVWRDTNFAHDAPASNDNLFRVRTNNCFNRMGNSSGRDFMSGLLFVIACLCLTDVSHSTISISDPIRNSAC